MSYLKAYHIINFSPMKQFLTIGDPNQSETTPKKVAELFNGAYFFRSDKLQLTNATKPIAETNSKKRISIARFCVCVIFLAWVPGGGVVLVLVLESR